jgi:DNA-directed RNA polymerase subunit F
MTTRNNQKLQKVRDDLRKIIAEFHKKMADVDPEELDEAIEEAVRAAKRETAEKLKARRTQ